MSDVVWTSTLDERYEVKVVRKGEYQGYLTITDTTTGDALGSKDVGLAYAARFGPDVEDIRDWQEWAVGIVDARDGA